jgi:hypothetical protein
VNAGADILERPDIRRNDVGPGDVTHVVRKREVTDALVYGEEIVALCGHRWVPAASPETATNVCQPCLAELARLRGAG